jgi:hypothetical protein
MLDMPVRDEGEGGVKLDTRNAIDVARLGVMGRCIIASFHFISLHAAGGA